MNNKRQLSHKATNRKRICTGVRPPPLESWPSTENSTEQAFDVGIVGTDTKAALLFLKSLFPLERFERRLPPILLQHQLYSIVQNRTIVDKEVGELRQTGEIRLFKLGSEPNEFCIVFADDYRSHVVEFTKNLDVDHSLVDRFLSDVISSCQDISLNKQKMADFHFTDVEITQLVRACVLTVRDVGSWWIAIPGAGIFTKSYTCGRRAALMMIKKSKYKQILQQELESRRLPKAAKLGMAYHIHDLIGGDLVDCVPTTSGPLLRAR